MIRSRKLFSITSIIIGIFFFVLSISAIGFYIYTAVNVIGKSDISLLFWFSVFFIFGIIFFFIGGYFFFIGWQLYKGNTSFYKINKYSLVVFFVFLVLLMGYSTLNGNRLKKQEEVRVELESKRSDIEKSMHRIKQVGMQNNQNGIDLSIVTTGGMAGEYELKTTITFIGKTYITTDKKINLSSQEEQIHSRVSFVELFRKCFEDQTFSSEYLCIQNTGTSNSMFNVMVTFTYLGFKEQSQLDDAVVLQDTKELSFSADTMNKNGKVEVSNLTIDMH